MRPALRCAGATRRRRCARRRRRAPQRPERGRGCRRAPPATRTDESSCDESGKRATSADAWSRGEFVSTPSGVCIDRLGSMRQPLTPAAAAVAFSRSPRPRRARPPAAACRPGAAQRRQAPGAAGAAGAAASAPPEPAVTGDTGSATAAPPALNAALSACPLSLSWLCCC
jgi:hypothetical protein